MFRLIVELQKVLFVFIVRTIISHLKIKKTDLLKTTFTLINRYKCNCQINSYKILFGT